MDELISKINIVNDKLQEIDFNLERLNNLPKNSMVKVVFNQVHEFDFSMEEQIYQVTKMVEDSLLDKHEDLLEERLLLLKDLKDLKKVIEEEL